MTSFGHADAAILVHVVAHLRGTLDDCLFVVGVFADFLHFTFCFELSKFAYRQRLLLLPVVSASRVLHAVGLAGRAFRNVYEARK